MRTALDGGAAYDLERGSITNDEITDAVISAAAEGTLPGRTTPDRVGGRDRRPGRLLQRKGGRRVDGETLPGQ